jgi:hypothetical protein
MSPHRFVPDDHPLARLFDRLCRRSLLERVGLDDPDLATYLARLLSRFTHVDQLYRIRDVAGRPLDDVGEMLAESDPRKRARSFEREREVRRHIGDYTLFFLGLFPDYLNRHATTRVRDLFVDWARVGRESYRIVAAFNVGPHRDEAPLFAKLSDHYDFCVLGLSFVKQELARLARPEARAIRDTFDER